MNFSFSSKVSRRHCRALEELLFFNPRQHRVRDGILNSLEQFGHPRLEVSPNCLSVRVGHHEAQTLFAFDQDGLNCTLAGVVVFLRTSPADIAIVHIAVHPDYTLQGQRAGAGLGVILVEKVKEVAARIVGVKRVILFYRQELVIGV